MLNTHCLCSVNGNIETRFTTCSIKYFKPTAKNYFSELLSENYWHWQCTPGGSDGKGSACNARDSGSILGLGRSPREGNDNPLQYSCLEKSMDRGDWWAIVHRVTESDMTERLILSFWSLKYFRGGVQWDECCFHTCEYRIHFASYGCLSNFAFKSYYVRNKYFVNL